MVQAQAQLTPSGEVAVFAPDDNQFGAGQSVDKCGPEAVATMWHSVAPGHPNPYTAEDIHVMAHDDYIKFCGPDVPSDSNGTSDQQLYAMLEEHGFRYDIGPASIAWVKEQLDRGLIVIIGISESSVVDNALGANPYNWNTTGLNHIIVASGAGAGGELLVRDTANIDHSGIVRPGPRHYDANRLQLFSATAVHPTWITNPPPPAPPDPDADAKAAWSAGGMAKAPFISGYGIPESYASHFHAGHYFGFPLEAEQYVEQDGVTYAEQAFSAGFARWNKQTGQTSWQTPGGLVE